MKTEFPRMKIAAEISDLRQMREGIANLIGTACALITQGQAAGVSDQVGLELVAAIHRAEQADQIIKDRIQELYNMPTPRQAANDSTEGAAA